MIPLSNAQREYLTEIYNEVNNHIEVTKEHTPDEFVILETKLKQILNTNQYHCNLRNYLNVKVPKIRERLSKGVNAELLMDDLLSDELDKLLKDHIKYKAMARNIMGVPSSLQGR